MRSTPLIVYDRMSCRAHSTTERIRPLIAAYFKGSRVIDGTSIHTGAAGKYPQVGRTGDGRCHGPSTNTIESNPCLLQSFPIARFFRTTLEVDWDLRRSDRPDDQENSENDNGLRIAHLYPFQEVYMPFYQTPQILLFCLQGLTSIQKHSA